MPGTSSKPAVRLLTAALIALTASFATAQGRGPGGGGPGGPGGMSHGTFGGGMSMPNRNSPPPGVSPNGSNPSESTMRGGFQLGPPGRWWDDKHFAQNIGLDPDQQHRMDDIFSANKGNLVKLYKGLQHEESQLEKVTRARELNEPQIFDQIDRVVQARGDLEKATAHYLLQIRKEMTSEQTAKLDDHRPSQ